MVSSVDLTDQVQDPFDALVPSVSGVRRDWLRNRRRLFAVVSALIQEGEEVTMHAVAERADIAIATAYRHFPAGVEDIIHAHSVAVLEEMGRFTSSSEASGEQVLEELLDHWISLVETHGHIMVNRRSPRGILERMDEEDNIMLLVTEVWGEPIKEFLAARNLDAGLARHALFLSNQMFDPRDILDLISHGRIQRDTLRRMLIASYEGALRGWASAAV